MDQENTIVYVDLNRPSSIMSNYTFNQGKKFNAFTEHQKDRTYFVNINFLINKLGLDEATKLLTEAAKND